MVRLADGVPARYRQRMRTLRDRYRLLDSVAVGGQGEVWKAVDTRHDRYVAVKVRNTIDGAAEAQAMHEAKMLLSMPAHPGLPVLREDFFEDGRLHLVMDWVEGTDLGTRVAAQGPFGPDEALRLLEPVAKAIDHLHSNSPPIVHRDIKPANLILTPQGVPVLVDLGIAATAGEQGGGTGTRGFTAPEVLAGSPATPASDVFSFAATAFALMFGEPPRPGLDFGFSELDEHRARMFELGLTRGLAFDPGRRPNSASALISLMRTGEGTPTNLRPALSPIIGREREIEEIAGLLADRRMVTLTGEGGLGKTRITQQVAAGAMSDFADGVWFIDLAPLEDPSLLVGEVARAVGADGPDAEALLAHLSGRTALIVLDNCEHMVEAVKDVAEHLLGGCPRVTLLSTSRTNIGVELETVYRLAPMTLPGTDDASSIQTNDAVRLFADRARRADPSFRLSSHVDDVAAICRGLEGVPLAIELAAARCKVMTPAEIRGMLGDLSLVSEPGGRSLARTIQWSCDQLDERSLSAFRSLGVFRGGFDFASAGAIGCDIDAITALVDRSLIRPVRSPTGTRFTMLETIRRYALGMLDSSEEGKARNSHLAHFHRLVVESEPKLGGPEQADLLRRLEMDHDNIRAALEFGLEAQDPLGAEIAAAAWRFWEIHDHADEGRRWVAKALSRTQVAPIGRARLLRADGGLALSLGSYDEARECLTEASRLARDASDLPLAAACLNALAAVEGMVGDLDAEQRMYEQCLDVWTSIGHERGIAVTLGNLGTCSFELGDVDEAEARFNESLGRRTALGDDQGIAACRNGLGLVQLARGSYEQARDHFDAAHHIWLELGSRRGEAIALTNIATVGLLQGLSDVARSGYESAIEICDQIGAQREKAEAVFGLAETQRSSGDPSAGDTHREALLTREAIGDTRGLKESIAAAAAIGLAAGFTGAHTLAATVHGWLGDGFFPSPIATIAFRYIADAEPGPATPDAIPVGMALSMLDPEGASSQPKL